MGSLALGGHPSRDGVTIKVLYGEMFCYIDQPCTPSFSTGLVKTESVTVRSIETGLGR